MEGRHLLALTLAASLAAVAGLGDGTLPGDGAANVADNAKEFSSYFGTSSENMAAAKAQLQTVKEQMAKAMEECSAKEVERLEAWKAAEQKRRVMEERKEIVVARTADRDAAKAAYDAAAAAAAKCHDCSCPPPSADGSSSPCSCPDCSGEDAAAEAAKADLDKAEAKLAEAQAKHDEAVAEHDTAVAAFDAAEECAGDSCTLKDGEPPVDLREGGCGGSCVTFSTTDEDITSEVEGVELGDIEASSNAAAGGAYGKLELPEGTTSDFSAAAGSFMVSPQPGNSLDDLISYSDRMSRAYAELQAAMGKDDERINEYLKGLGGKDPSKLTPAELQDLYTFVMDTKKELPISDSRFFSTMGFLESDKGKLFLADVEGKAVANDIRKLEEAKKAIDGTLTSLEAQREAYEFLLMLADTPMDAIWALEGLNDIDAIERALQARLGELDAALAEKAGKRDELKDRKEALDLKVKEAEAKAKQAQDAYDACKIDAACSADPKKLDGYKKEATSSSQSLDTLKKDLEKVNEQLQTAESELAKDAAERKARAEALEKDIKEAEAKRIKAEQELKAAQYALAACKVDAACSADAARMEKLADAVQKTQSEKDKLDLKIKDDSKTLDQINSGLATLTAVQVVEKVSDARPPAAGGQVGGPQSGAAPPGQGGPAVTISLTPEELAALKKAGTSGTESVDKQKTEKVEERQTMSQQEAALAAERAQKEARERELELERLRQDEASLKARQEKVAVDIKGVQGEIAAVETKLAKPGLDKAAEDALKAQKAELEIQRKALEGQQSDLGKRLDVITKAIADAGPKAEEPKGAEEKPAPAEGKPKEEEKSAYATVIAEIEQKGVEVKGKEVVMEAPPNSNPNTALLNAVSQTLARVGGSLPAQPSAPAQTPAVSMGPPAQPAPQQPAQPAPQRAAQPVIIAPGPVASYLDPFPTQYSPIGTMTVISAPLVRVEPAEPPAQPAPKGSSPSGESKAPPPELPPIETSTLAAVFVGGEQLETDDGATILVDSVTNQVYKVTQEGIEPTGTDQFHIEERTDPLTGSTSYIAVVGNATGRNETLTSLRENATEVSEKACIEIRYLDEAKNILFIGPRCQMTNLTNVEVRVVTLDDALINATKREFSNLTNTSVMLLDISCVPAVTVERASSLNATVVSYVKEMGCFGADVGRCIDVERYMVVIGKDESLWEVQCIEKEEGGW